MYSSKYISEVKVSEEQLHTMKKVSNYLMDNDTYKYNSQDTLKRVVKIKPKKLDKHLANEFPIALASFIDNPYYNSSVFIVISRQSKDECYKVESNAETVSSFFIDLHYFTNTVVINKELSKVDSIYLISYSNHEDYFCNSNNLTADESKLLKIKEVSEGQDGHEV